MSLLSCSASTVAAVMVRLAWRGPVARDVTGLVRSCHKRCVWPGEVLTQGVFAGAPVERKLFKQCGFAGLRRLRLWIKPPAPRYQCELQSVRAKHNATRCFAFASAMRHAGSDSRPEPICCVHGTIQIYMHGVPRVSTGVYHTRDSCGTQSRLYKAVREGRRKSRIWNPNVSQ